MNTNNSENPSEKPKDESSKNENWNGIDVVEILDGAVEIVGGVLESGVEVLSGILSLTGE